jgi:tetratricopeptide (TPR) repeat protein
MLNCAALADLRLAEGRLPEAKRYCQLALEVMERTDDTHMRGNTYRVVGKVTYEEARRAEGARRRELLEETVVWFQKSCEHLASTQAYPDIAEVYGQLAQALEELERVEEAIECWRSGYEVLSHTKKLSDEPMSLLD